MASSIQRFTGVTSIAALYIKPRYILWLSSEDCGQHPDHEYLRGRDQQPNASDTFSDTATGVVWQYR